MTTTGKWESVQYQELPALLLNELQKQHQEIQRQNVRIAEQENETRAFEARAAALERLLQGQRRSARVLAHRNVN